MSRSQIPECRKKYIDGEAIMVWEMQCSGCENKIAVKRPRHPRLGKDIMATSEACIVRVLGWAGVVLQKTPAPHQVHQVYERGEDDAS